MGLKAPRLRGLALLLVIVLAASACSSTTTEVGSPAADGTAAPSEDARPLGSGTASPATGTNPSRDPDVDAPSAQVPPEEGGSAQPDTPADPGEADPSDPEVPTGSPSAPEAPPETPSDPEAPDTRSSGRGFTETQVKIGFPVPKDAGAGNAALGGSGLEQGDEREILRAVVEEVNRTGGMAGREVVPIIYEVEENSSQTWEQQFQAACTYWTEDEPVFAAHVNSQFTRDSVRACLNDHGVPVWRGGFHTNMDAAVYEKYPLWVEAPAMGLSQVSRTLAEDLVAQDFFSSTGVVDEVKLGLVRYEPSYYDRATEEHLKPALARHGLEIDQEVQISEPNSISDASGAAAQLGNAVLRFRREGVTHVLFLEESSLLSVLFMRQADPQEYRPLYGLHSMNGFQAGLVPNVPERQLHGSVGIGYAPVFDVPIGDAPPTPGQTRCMDVMEREGIDLPSQFGRYLALETCETFFSLQAAGRGAGEPLTADGLMAGLYALGDSYPSVVAPQTSYANQRRDGAAAYRRVAYVEDCTCFQYTSDLLPAR